MARRRKDDRPLIERIDSGLLSTANVRRCAQLAAFCLFFLLLLLSIKRSNNVPDFRGSLFFDFDPLILITTYLSAHTVESALFLSVVTLVTTVIFGRFFCGWICPFGAVHAFVGWLGRKFKIARKGVRAGHTRAHGIKKLILGAVLVSALFGGQLIGYLDPIALLTRTFTTAVLPALAFAMNGLYGFLERFDLGQIGNTAVGFLYLPFEGAEISGRFHAGGVLIGFLFVLLLALNLYRERFFCRYLCPLGALLGIVSKWSIVRFQENEACTSCTLCERNCPSGAEPGPGGAFRVEECVFCYNCTEACPEHGFVASVRREESRPKGADPTRRDFVFGAVAGAMTVPLIKSPWQPRRVSPDLIRPPGALAEQEFLSKCIRCAACMRACPTNVLQPAFAEAGLDGFWSPVMKYRFGYCQYGCTICSQSCPTGAIQQLPLEEKKKWRLGNAFFDKNRCLPYALGRECTVCEEHCPTAPKAIITKKKEVERPDGTRGTAHVPEVVAERCIGCGICENVCPIVDMAGIRVTSAGESRSEENQFLAK